LTISTSSFTEVLLFQGNIYTKYKLINLVPSYLAQSNEDDESADEEIMEIEQAEYMNGWVRIDECQCCRDVKRNLTV